MGHERYRPRPVLAFLLVASLIIGVWQTSLRSASAQTGGTWTFTGSLKVARVNHTATLLHSGKVLVMSLKSSELYNPATGVWVDAGVPHAPRVGNSATLLNNGEVLIAGGFYNVFPGGGPFNSAELYDPISDSWRIAAFMIRSYSNHRAVLLQSGRVLIVGIHYDGISFKVRAETYDPGPGTWSDTNAPLDSGVLVLLPNGQVLSVAKAASQLYNPVTGLWSNTNKPNIISDVFTATLLNNGHVLLTGSGPGGSGTTAELYDASTGSWRVTNSPPLDFAQATLLADGRVLGTVAYDSGLPKALLYNPATETWSLTGDPKVLRFYASATLLPDGRVLVAGGDDGSEFENIYASAELYTPSLTTPGPDTVQFSLASYTVNEGAGHATIVVNRSNPAGPATVDYTTSDILAVDKSCKDILGVASARCDYVTTGGTLRFGAGEISKVITVPIVNDAFVEGNETFTVTLSNVVGSGPGSPSTATVTIQDNDTNPNAPNPFLDNAFFVRQHYLDFLLREPDTAGFNAWLSVLNGCGPAQGWLGSPPGCDRVHVSSGFFRSTEFGEKGYWIYRFYESALGRRPAFAEFNSELRRLSGQMTDAEQEARRVDFVSRFMQLPAFIANFNGLTDSPSDAAALIAKLEQVGRVTLPASANTEPGQPPQYSRQQLVDLMASGQFTAAQTLRAFIEQKIVWDTYFYRAFVAMQYFGYLQRDPEQTGYDDWVRVLTFGDAPSGIPPGDYRHLIFGFIYSVEYRERFGRP